MSATSRNDSLSFLPCSPPRTANLFFYDRTSFSLVPYLYILISSRRQRERVTLKQTRIKSRGFSAIVIRSEFNSPFRQREAHRRDALSLYPRFDASASRFLSRNKETISTTHARRTLDPVTQWPRTAASMHWRYWIFFFFITLRVREMNECTRTMKTKRTIRRPCLTVTDRRGFDANPTIWRRIVVDSNWVVYFVDWFADVPGNAFILELGDFWLMEVYIE